MTLTQIQGLQVPQGPINETKKNNVIASILNSWFMV